MTLEVDSESVARRLLYKERAQPNMTPDMNIAFVVEGSEDMLEYRYGTCHRFLFSYSSVLHAAKVKCGCRGWDVAVGSWCVITTSSLFLYYVYSSKIFPIKCF